MNFWGVFIYLCKFTVVGPFFLFSLLLPFFFFQTQDNNGQWQNSPSGSWKCERIWKSQEAAERSSKCLLLHGQRRRNHLAKLHFPSCLSVCRPLTVYGSEDEHFCRWFMTDLITACNNYNLLTKKSICRRFCVTIYRHG